MMQSVRFDFHGQHELLVPDGDIYRGCALDIIEGRCYPFPANGPPVKSVVDLGAHAGEFTVMAALCWPEAAIHAYEPNPQILPLLKHNCLTYPQIVIHEQGVGVEPRRDKLYFSQVGSVAATTIKPRRAPPAGHEFKGVDVEIVGPEAIAAHNPDVLKMDIEGPEGVFLEALGDLSGINRIYVEFHHENIRLHIDKLASPTHCLAYAHILRPGQGEVMYVRKE